MNDKLQPVNCGCGGKAEIFHIAPDAYEGSYCVRCTKCLTQTPFFSKDKEKAIAVWNQAMSHQVTITWDGRIPPRKITKVNIYLHPCGISGECLNCGGDVYNEDPYCSHCGARLEWK